MKLTEVQDIIFLYLLINNALNIIFLLLNETNQFSKFIIIKWPCNRKMFINKEPIYKLRNDYGFWYVDKYSKRWITLLEYTNNGIRPFANFIMSMILPFIIRIKYYKYMLENSYQISKNEIETIDSLEEFYEKEDRAENEKRKIINSFDNKIDNLNKEFKDNYIC